MEEESRHVADWQFRHSAKTVIQEWNSKQWLILWVFHDNIMTTKTPFSGFTKASKAIMIFLKVLASCYSKQSSRTFAFVLFGLYSVTSY